MKIIVTDRESIESGLLVRSGYALISIRDSKAVPIRLPNPAGPLEILHLAFDDAEPLMGIQLPAQIQLMTPNHAFEIWRFVERHKSDVGAFVVHCHQGMSRSPAVAAAMAIYLGLEEQPFWKNYQPNQHVYQLMRQTMPGAGKMTKPLETDGRAGT